MDAESGERFEVRADNVVNATGVWADRIRPEEILAEEEVPRIAPSRGTHVTVSFDKLPLLQAACIVPAGEERTIFALPWYGRALIGTTDRDYDGDIAHVQPSGEDVEYLLEAVNSFFGLELARADVTGAYAGVRPLISTGDPRKSVDISRRAELYETSSGLLTITGGKLTTWRRMAKQVVDRMVEREGREAPCRTAEIPLGMPASEDDLRAPRRPVARTTCPTARVELLAFRYGHAARNVLKLAGERPELAGPIVPGQPDLLAEAVIAARLEQARSVADVLLRRTRLGLLAAPQLRDAESVRPVAEALGGELGWSADRVRRGGRGLGRRRGKRGDRSGKPRRIGDVRLFIDTGSVAEVEEIAAWGILAGATTNPSLLAKEEGDPGEIIQRICDLVGGPVSAEVVSSDPEG